MKTIGWIGCLLVLCVGSLGAQQPRWVRSGHLGGINAVTFSPDGRYLASVATQDLRILVWDTKTLYSGPREYTYPFSRSSYRHVYGEMKEGQLMAVEYTSDGRHLWAGGDTMLYEWDLVSGNVVDSIAPLTQAIVKIGLSTSGDTLLWASAQGFIVRYNIRTRTFLDTITVIDDGGNLAGDIPGPDYLAFSRDLTRIAYSGNGPAVRSLLVGTPYSQQIVMTSGVRGFCFSTSGKYLALSSDDSSIVVETATGSNVLKRQINQGPISIFGFSGSEDSVVYSRGDSEIVIANIHTGAESVLLRMQIQTTRAFGSSYALSPECRQIAAGSMEADAPVARAVRGSISVANFESRTIKALTANEGNLTGIGWSPIADELTASDNAGVIQQYLATDGSVKQGNRFGRAIGALQYTKDGSRLAGSFMYEEEGAETSNNIGYLTADSLKETSKICDILYLAFGAYSGSGLLLSPNGTQYAIRPKLGHDTEAFVDDIGQGCVYKLLLYPRGYGFSPDGSMFLIGDSTHLVQMVTANHSTTGLPDPNKSSIRSASFSPDGMSIIVAHGDSSLELLSYPSCTEIHRMGGGTAPIDTASFSPDGKYILASCFDSTLRIWDVRSGMLAYTFPKWRSRIYEVGFSFDMKYVAARNNAATVIVWDTPPLAGLAQAAPVSTTSLLQNMPNPVTRETTIAFTLPYSEEVTLTLSDVMGREVALLARGRLEAGQHAVSIGAETFKLLVPGIYYYRLEAVSGTATKQMVVE